MRAARAADQGPGRPARRSDAVAEEGAKRQATAPGGYQPRRRCDRYARSILRTRRRDYPSSQKDT